MSGHSDGLKKPKGGWWIRKPHRVLGGRSSYLNAGEDRGYGVRSGYL